MAGTPGSARIAEAAWGPGADTVTLAQARPGSEILAVDLHEGFVEQAQARCAHFGEWVSVRQMNYLEIPGDFDLIWCAGAVYFVGIEKALTTWKKKLRPNGRVAFSEPAWLTEDPSPAARAFWAGEGSVESVSKLTDRIEQCGWRVIDDRKIVRSAWQAYYNPMQKRLDALSASNPDENLQAAIQETQQEIDKWHQASDEIAYALFVVEPP